MKKRITKFLTILAVLFFSLQSAICQPYNIDYYGIVSSEIDDNMAKMLSDLYYTQFQEISSFNVTDKRTQDCLKTIPSNDSIDSSNFSFYSIITKENAKWISNLTIKNKKIAIFGVGASPKENPELPAALEKVNSVIFSKLDKDLNLNIFIASFEGVPIIS